MAHKGFIKMQNGRQPARDAVKRLQQTGIPLKSIFIESKFRLDAEWLRNGDHLTVYSLAELFDRPDSLLHILGTMINRKIHLHALDEPWYDTDTKTVQQHICGLARLSGSTADYSWFLSLSQKKLRGRPRGLTSKSLAKCKACEKLMLTAQQPLLDILESQGLCYVTWRRYVRNYQPKQMRKNKKLFN